MLAAASSTFGAERVLAQLPSQHIIRGYEGTPGSVSCLPKGAARHDRITSCREVSSKATLNGISGDLISYFTPTGDRIDEFYTSDTYSNCSVYNGGCETLARVGSNGFRRAIKKVDPSIGVLTVVSLYLDGMRILSIVEDRG